MGAVMKKEYGTHLNIILNTMCLFAGVNYNDIDMQEDNWFFKHTWSEETEKEFKHWMVNYLHKIKPAQREVCDSSYMKKADCERAVDMFLLNYSWCSKQPEWYLNGKK
jgi:hypothetical protein